MITATHHKQHRSGQRRGGAAPRAASRAVHTSAAPMDVQDRPGLRVRAGLFDATHSKATGGGFGRRTFYIPIARRCPLIGLSDRRVALLLPTEQPATLFDTFADQLPGKVSDPLKLHSSNRLSSSVASDEKHRSERHLEPCSRNRGIEYPR